MTSPAFDYSLPPEERHGRRRWFWGLWSMGAPLCIALALFSYRWFLPIGFRPPAILANAFAKPWLYCHIAAAATALLIAPVQLLPALRRRGRSWHRWLGRAYMAASLVGGVGGLVSAFGSTAGPVAISGFATLAVVYIVVNAMGWLRATQRRFLEHSRLMVYSFAMTFAAVTLRIELPILVLAHLSFADSYRAVAWVSWLGNLAVAELYLRSPRSGAGPYLLRIASGDAERFLTGWRT